MTLLIQLALTRAVIRPAQVVNGVTKLTDSNFESTEKPVFFVDTKSIVKADTSKTSEGSFAGSQGKIKATVLNVERHDIGIAPTIEPTGKQDDKFLVSIPVGQEIRPGKLTLSVEMSNAKTTQVVEQDFTWGVLAFNFDQSSYKVNEPVGMGVGVLDEKGVTLCDADVRIVVTSPQGRRTLMTTDNDKITISDMCVDKSVTNKPDYAATYTPTTHGTYRVKLIAKTKNGTQEREETFTVTDDATMVIKRTETPTRINPESDYWTTITTTTTTDFTGNVLEKTPNSFTILEIQGSVKHADGREERIAGSLQIDPKTTGLTTKEDQTQTLSQNIVWPVKLRVGDQLTLKYHYKMPLISPEFYLLGPLAFNHPVLATEGTLGGQVVEETFFAEPRAWQIASDAVTNNGLMVYGRQLNTGLTYARTFTGTSTANAEITTTDYTASAIQFVKSAAAPTREEVFIANQQADGQLNTFTCTADCNATGDYTTRGSLAGITTAANATGRAFDIAYEQLSGRAMVVFGDDSAQGATGADDKAYYCLWNGTSWAPATVCAATFAPGATNEINFGGTTGVGKVRWVRLVPYGDRNSHRSDEMLLAVSGTTGFALARWDGDSWENITLISDGTALATTAQQSFDVAWEQESGNGLAMWTDTTAATGIAQYRKYTAGSGWDSSNQTSQPDTGAGNNSWIELASDPSSNRISVMIGDSEDDAHIYIWKSDNTSNNFVVSGTNPIDATVESNLGKDVATVWTRFTSQALFIYTDSNDLESDAVVWTSAGGFNNTTCADVGGSNSDDVDNIVAIGSSNSDDALILRGDILDDMVATRWDGNGCLTTDFTRVPAAGTNAADLSVTADNTAPIEFWHSYFAYSAWSLNWRFFDDETIQNPTTGLNGAAENATPTNVDPGEVFRLRVNLAERSGMAQTDARKKLQYTYGCDPNTSTTCSWTDVGDTTETTTTTIFRYATAAETCTSNCDDGDSSPGTALTGSNADTIWVSDKDAAAAATFDQPRLTIQEIDYPLKAQYADENTTYYFRVYDVSEAKPILREQDNDGNNDCATATCTYPSLTMKASYTPTYNQTNTKLESDDGGTGSGGTDTTTPYTIKKGERLNVRIQVENTGEPKASVFRLEFDKNSNASWTRVTGGAEVQPAVSPTGVNMEPVVTRKAGSCGGSVTYSAGTFYEGRGVTNSEKLFTNECSEYVFSLDTANIALGVVYRLRLYNATGNAALGTYTNYATFTAAASQTVIHSKGRFNSLPTATSEARHLLDKVGYTNVASDDSLSDVVANVLGDNTADMSLHNPEPNDSDLFGSDVYSAGDVNGDGFEDFISGCRSCDSGGAGTGTAYVYFGSRNVDTVADLTFSNPEATASDNFGRDVASAGDVNGDGYDDIILGCDTCDGSGTTDSGSAFVYYGGSSMDTTADVSIHNPEATLSDVFGSDVAGVGDVNGDGYEDVVIGCEACDGSGTANSGSSFVYYGGSSMDNTADVSIHTPEATASDAFGTAVSGPGDVNGDGFSDVLIGCDLCDGGLTDSGSAFIYYGGSSMNATVDVSLNNPEASLSDAFARDVSAAGDVNGDGFMDVLMSCQLCDGSGTIDSGSAFIFYGGSSMDTTVDISIHNPEATGSDQFGVAVAGAGDVNGDGFSDVVLGCYNCDGSGTTDSGSAFVYYGGSSMNTTADITMHNPEATNGDRFAIAVAIAGDVDGDGYKDVLVGCQFCDGSGTTDAGSAFTYLMGALMDNTNDKDMVNPEADSADQFSYSVSAAGDVNGDGYVDMIVSCPSCDGSGTTNAGSAFIYFGGVSMDTTVDVSIHNPEPTASDRFSLSVSAAGDVNGDGYSDVIIGCNVCDGSGTTDAGSAFIYFGGSTMNNTADVSIHNPEPTLSDFFARYVSSAGDVNGDGYSDVIISCEVCDGSGTTDSGSAFIYYGGSSMDNTADVSIHNPEATASDRFGTTPSIAGDVNSDGYSDVVIGCDLCDGSGTTDTGSAFVYYGGSSMNNTVDISIHNPEATNNDRFGNAVTNGDDINADGYADVIIGCYRCDASGTTNGGSVYVYYGASSMDTTPDVSIHNPEATLDDLFSGNANVSSLTTGDVNGDNYADIMVGCMDCDGSGTTDTGSGYVYLGGITMDTTTDFSIHNPESTSDDDFGTSSAVADFNRDGYVDIVFGCDTCDLGGAGSSGAAYTYMGGKSAALASFYFTSKHTTNADGIDVSWKGRSTVAASSANLKLQVYRYGSTNAWEDVTTNTTLAANTEGTITGSITSNKTEYYDGSTVTHWRVYQASTNQIMQSQYINFTFVGPPVYNQTNAKIESDDGGNGASGTNIGTPYTIKVGERINVRLQIENTGGRDTSAYQLQYDKNSAGAWSNVKTGAEIQPTLSLLGDNGEPTTFSRAGSCGGSVTYTAGTFHEGQSVSTAKELGNNKCTEYVFTVDTANAAVSVAYRFRLFNLTANAALGTYTNYATFTAASAQTVLHSKSRNTVLPAAPTDLRYLLDNTGYTNTGSDDALLDLLSNVLSDTTPDVSQHNPETTGSADQFGFTVASAGDVNGDGYMDVIVGCHNCDDSGSTGSGSAFIYYGGAIPDTTPDVTILNPENTLDDVFGRSVSSAGDVNGDGYSDVIVGCEVCDGSGTTNSGSAFIYYGGSSMNSTVDVSIHNPEPTAVTLDDGFGMSVSSARDVNGDGYSDVLIGCNLCDGSGTTDSGSAFVYYGGSSMDNTVDVSIHNPEATGSDRFGYSVSNAGNVNGDAYMDIIIGCYWCDGSGTANSGSAYIYYGGSSMNATEDVSIHTPEPTLSDFFGLSVSSAADINGDGFGDVIVGCDGCDGSGTTDAGSAFVYYGGSSMNNTVDVSIHSPEPTGFDSFGISVSSGDFNGDGFSDVIIGCYACDGSGTADSGSAYVYFGSGSMDTTADYSLHNPEATGSDNFGRSAANAGDVNGDGFIDLIVGCDGCDGGGTEFGSAFTYYMASLTDATSDKGLHNPEPTAVTLDDNYSVALASAGDVNRDGYADVIAGCTLCDDSGTTDSGSAYIYLGGPTMDTVADVALHNPEPTAADFFGTSVSSAGDVNGDGFGDVIVGCLNCDGSGTTDSGSAFVYYGGTSMDTTADVSIHNPEATTGDDFGNSVSFGKDINGDSYSDVIVGCPECDGSGTTNSGSAFVYYGAGSMNATVDISIHNPEPTAVTLDDLFGAAVSSGDDVNGDGYSDVVVGCYRCDGSGTTDSGSVYVYYGASSMDTTADVSIHNPESTADDKFGSTVSSVGDSNGDGYSDIVIGCWMCDGSGTADSGSAFVYYGGSTMNNTVDLSIHNPEATASDAFGISVTGRGDINGDGYSDIVVGCDSCDGSGTANSGSAFVYYGGISMDTTADVSIHNPEATLDDFFGYSLASLGDVTGDGYGDIFVGCQACDGSLTTDSGSIYGFMGGKSADISAYYFSSKNTSSNATIDVTWKGKTSVAASTANLKLQVYRYGSTNAWEDVTTNTTLAADTNGTITGATSTNPTEYFDADTVTHWRLYQAATNQILQSQYITFTFTPVGASPTFNQVNYRFGSGTVNNISYSGAPAENTAFTVSTTGQDFRLRMSINVGTATLTTAAAQNFKLRFGEKPAGGCSAATYADVATGAGVIRYVDIGGIADGDNIALVTGDPDYTGIERYQDYEESNNFTNSVADIGSGENGVWDFSLENNSSVGSKRYCFKVTKSDGTDLNTYTHYPEVIIDEELTFSLDATSKNFGTITPGASASDQTSTLTTTTNAANGYQVTLWQSQLLTRTGGQTIANWTGTNATPTTLSGAGSSAFGYSTNDSNLGGGTANRFTSAANLFAGFVTSGSGDIVADNATTPVTNDQFTVTYRLRAGAAQESGTYTTTVIYINTASY